MSDFEQRIDIIEINLPKPEDLNLFWMKGRDVGPLIARAEQEMAVIPIQFVPSLFDPAWDYHIVIRVTAFLIVISL